MNINTPSRNLIVRIIQNFFTKLSQHPEFYNTRHSKKKHRNNRHKDMGW